MATNQSELLYLSKSDMAELPLTTSSIIQSIEQLCQGRETGGVQSAPKGSIRPDPDRLYMTTLASADEPPFMAVKSLGMNAANAAEGQDIIGSLITLFDSRTGLPLAVMDGDWITGIRTAGLSATVAKRCAHPGSSAIAFIGCGMQARSHLSLFADLFPLREMRAFGRGTYNRDVLCAQASNLGLAAVACDKPQDAIAQADLVISSVPSSAELKPFLDAGWLKETSFSSLVDLGRSWLPDTFVRYDKIIIDDAVQEATMKDPMVALDQINGDLQDLVSGRLRVDPDTTQRTAFIFRGIAIGDLALAILAYQCALDNNIGTQLPR